MDLKDRSMLVCICDLCILIQMHMCGALSWLSLLALLDGG